MGQHKSTETPTHRRFLSNPIALALLGLCLISLTLYLWKVQESRSLSQVHANTASRARSYASEAETRYSWIHQALTRLAARGAPRDQSGEDAWEEDATFYLDAFPSIGRIAWVDSAFRIRRIAPTEGNESYLGQYANSTTGGRSAVNLWLPIYDDGVFEGFVFAGVFIDAFFAPVLKEIGDSFMLQISEEGVAVFGSENWKDPQAASVVHETITLKNTTVLHLTFAPTDEWVHSSTADARRTLVFGLLLSFIAIVAAHLARNFSVVALLNESHYRSLFAASRDAIFLFDLKGKYQDANPAAMRMVGYSLAELRRLTLADLRPQGDPLSSRDRTEMWTKGGMQELLLCSKSRELIPVELVTSPIAEGRGRRYVLGIARDITERKRAEAENLSLEARLRQSQKLESIGTLASGVAHEINNPLMGMIGYAELIGDGVDDPRIRGYSADIIKEGNRVATIVRNLLSFSRQDKNTHSLADIKDIIDASLSLVGAALRKDQITLDIDVPGELPQVKCRSQQIQQVIINLLTNARDALNERYPDYAENKLIRITAHPFEKDGATWIRATVEDHGSGIPEGVAERIFDPFFTTKPRDRGTGLGLSLSFGIVREHHGELTVESVSGEYSRFHMDLPVDHEHALGDREARV